MIQIILNYKYQETAVYSTWLYSVDRLPKSFKMTPLYSKGGSTWRSGDAVLEALRFPTSYWMIGVISTVDKVGWLHFEEWPSTLPIDVSQWLSAREGML